MSDNATSRRIEGPTPAGGAYMIGFFSYDGRPVPQRFANQMLIVEYDDQDQVIQETLGDCTPEAVLPRDFVAEPGGPSPPDSVLPLFSAALGRSRTAPRERSISEGPPMPTQAVCLARAYVVDSAAQADFTVAFMRASALLENRDDLDGRWVTTGEREAFFQFLDHGAARAVPRLPDGVEEEDVIVIDLGPDRRPATDRLRDVRDRLAADLEASANQEAGFAAWLATNALGSDDISTGVWRDLLEQGRRFTEYSRGTPCPRFLSTSPARRWRGCAASSRRPALT